MEKKENSNEEKNSSHTEDDNDKGSKEEEVNDEKVMLMIDGTEEEEGEGDKEWIRKESRKLTKEIVFLDTWNKNNIPLSEFKCTRIHVHVVFTNRTTQTQRLIYLPIGIGQSIHQTISPAHDNHFLLPGY